MMVLVTGGSGSGKSTYAEKLIYSLSEGKQKYYLATMQVYDEEGEKKIARHRMLRQGKGFVTIEQPTMIQNVIQKMATGEKTALLECISNLTANEMFSMDPPKTEETVVMEITDGIAKLKKEMTHLVIVSNNVFEDGRNYNDTTMAYIRAMGKINEKLATMSDEVTEVVAGIPIKVK